MPAATQPRAYGPKSEQIVGAKRRGLGLWASLAGPSSHECGLAAFCSRIPPGVHSFPVVGRFGRGDFRVPDLKIEWRIRTKTEWDRPLRMSSTRLERLHGAVPIRYFSSALAAFS